MPARYLSLILCVLSASLLQAQNVASFDKSTFNFGPVEAWDNPPAVFTFTNTSQQGQYILAPRHSRHISLEYPKEKIEPGASATITVMFYTENTGTFEEKVEFYFSGSSSPYSVTVKGNIRSLATGALTACPDFSSSGRKEVTETLIEGIVIDKETREPIPNASVLFAYNHGVQADKNGEFKVKLLMGLYQFHIWSEGYKELVEPVGIKRFNDKLVFALEKPQQVQITLRDTLVNTHTVLADTIPVIPDDNPDFSYRQYKANNIVLLVDVSGSMKRDGKIDSLKSAMKKLVGLMRSVDHVSLIAFSSYTKDVFINYTGTDKDEMLKKVDSLSAKGTTNGVLGIANAYELASQRFIAGGNNIILVATDGMFSDAGGNDGGFKKMAADYLAKGIKLSVIGFGEDRQGGDRMKKIAQAGGGNYIPFSSSEMNALKLVAEIKSQSAR